MACSCSCWNQPTTKDAYRLSWASLILTTLAAIAGCALFATTGSSLCLVFGLENCVDFLSSAVVLWRFFAPSKTVDEATELRLARREKRASIAISMILVLLGIGVIAAAGADLARGQEEDPNQLRAVVGISFVSILVFGVLAVLKFQYSVRLQSVSLYKDGVCSLIGTILAVALFIDTLIVNSAPQLWWIDPVVAMAIGLGAVIFGLVGVCSARYKENLPICSIKWWFVSRQEGDGEDNDQDQEGPIPPEKAAAAENGGVEMAATSSSDPAEPQGDLV